jgi:ferredoxin-NADP reductase
VLRRPPPTGARRRWQLGTVTAVTQENPVTRTFTLALPDGEVHVPGQHYVVRLTAEDGSQAQRSYSVASAPWRPGEPATIDLTVERIADGDLSPALHDHVVVGSQVEVRGPFGGWFVWRGDVPALLVGGGSGVVPLMSMLRMRRDRALAVALRLVVSVRTPQDLLYAGELTDAGGRTDAGRDTTRIYSRVVPAGYARPAGRLTADDVRPLLADLGPSAIAYVCGSAGFAEAASQLLVDVGLDASAIRVERFGPS